MSGSKVVYVRVNPTEEIDEDYISFDEDGQSLTFQSGKNNQHSFMKKSVSSYSFRFSSIFQDTDQNMLFNATTRTITENALNGVSSSIFAIGSKGSGKSYTFTGSQIAYRERGIIPRTIAYLFQKIAANPEHEIDVRCSFIEFVNEQLYDVLWAFNGQEPVELKILESKQGKISVKNLFTPKIANEQEGLERLFSGNAQRAMHPEHLQMIYVFTLWLDSTKSPPEAKPIHSKIHFVEMPTAVNLDPSTMPPNEFQRMSSINKAMTVLEQVLVAGDLVSFRSSPFTHFLKDALDSRTFLVHLNLSTPHLEQALSTLKYASRIQGNSNDDILNRKEHKDTQIARLQREIDEARAQLRVKNPAVTYKEPDREEKQRLSEIVTSYLSDALPQFPINSIAEVTSALALMKDAYRAQRVAVEEQLRERYVFTVKPITPEETGVDEPQYEPLDPDEGIAFFPLPPNEAEMRLIFQSTEGLTVETEITERKTELDEVRAKKREVGAAVNQQKEKIDELRGKIKTLEGHRPPPINGVPFLTEEELKFREELKGVKGEYKSKFAEFSTLKDREIELIDEIQQREDSQNAAFEIWLEEKRRVETKDSEEEEDDEELLDKVERRKRRDFQRAIEEDPTAGPFFNAGWRVKIILEREFRPNGTRRQPIVE